MADTDGTVHLFAALLHGEGIVTGQRAIPDKTGETKAFTPLLDTLDITGAIITADALHTVQAHATYLLKRGAFYVFTVKENTRPCSMRSTHWPGKPNRPPG
ncbi:MAG: transposase [Actinoallomurus sp.]|nr:transposase [Actinoallomurus sp.]